MSLGIQKNIVIVEDDRIIAENLKEQLHDMGYHNVAICWDKTSFTSYVENQHCDIIFADINLGESEPSGIELIKDARIDDTSIIIIISAYNDEYYRKQAADIHADAFLIKPISPNQIAVTLELAIANQSKRQRRRGSTVSSSMNHATDHHFFVKVKHKYEKIELADIRIIHANGSYTEIVIGQKTITVSSSLKGVLEHLGADEIVRCHRGHAVNLSYINAFDDHWVYINVGDKVERVPIGASYRSSLLLCLPKLFR